MRRALSLLVALLFVVEGAFAQEASKLANKIVAVVGDEVLTLYELDELAEPLYRTYLSREGSPEERDKLKQKIRREVLEQWIEDTLIGLEAKKFGIRVTDEELEEFLRLEAKGQRFSSNLSKEEREKLRDRFTKIKFIQLMLRDKIAIPEEELKRAYQEKIKNHQGVTRYELEVLLLKREAPLEEILSSIRRGKTLEEVAKENPTIALYVRETFREEELDGEILEKIRSLNTGEISSPIVREDRVKLLRVLRKEAPTPPAFEEMRKDLYEELFQKRAQEYLERWIRELKESRLIKIYL